MERLPTIRESTSTTAWYKLHGYTTMMGLSYQRGAVTPVAESHILALEDQLHRHLGSHEKFHSRLSNSQSGNLSKTPRQAVFVLYIALLPEDEEGTDDDTVNTS